MSIYTIAATTLPVPDQALLESLDAADAALAIETIRSDNFVDSLTKFIPTESITLYVAGLSGLAVADQSALPPYLSTLTVYWLCAVATPVIFIIILIRQRAVEGQSLMLDKWPIWKIVASTIAFLVWALAVPNGPYANSAAATFFAAFGAAFVSMFLSLLDPIFERLEMKRQSKQ